MKTFTWFILAAAALLLAGALAPGCGSGGGTSAGTMSVQLTDGPLDDLGISEVWVTVDSVSVHREKEGEYDEWIDLSPADASFPLTINLLAWQNGAAKALALDSLPAGHYTQVRLHLGDTAQAHTPAHPFANYVVASGNPEELVIPSGHTSGLKLTHEFDIQAGVTYGLTLDFDAERSIHLTGSGKYMMRPTIRVVQTDLTGTITGTVSAGGGCSLSAEGVTVTAQQQSDPDDPSTVEVVATALTDAEGHYTLAFLPPGSYTVVAFKAGANDECGLGFSTGVAVSAGQTTAGQDITLTCDTGSAQTIEVTGVPEPTPPATKEEIVPLVRIVGALEGGGNYVLTTVGATYVEEDDNWQGPVVIPGITDDYQLFPDITGAEAAWVVI